MTANMIVVENAGEALRKAAVKIVNVRQLLFKMTDEGLLRKTGRTTYEVTGRKPEATTAVGEDLEARKAALGIAVKKKDDND